MSEMVERVARAIYEAWATAEECSVPWGELVVRAGEHAARHDGGYPNAAKWHDMAFAEARAAIEAMREPTEAMVEASNREWDGRMSHRSAGAWQAMIDAALAP